MNESDMPNLLQEEIIARDRADFWDAQQAKDEEYFKTMIEQILRKCENGMCTQDDIFELRSCLRYYRINV